MVNPIVLVGCAKSKEDKPTEAKNLYTSSYFKKKYTVAETIGTPRILSAQHGIVKPDTVLEPYDTSIYDLTANEKREWGDRVVRTLKKGASSTNNPVIALAGKAYSRPLRSRLNTPLYEPFAGTSGIGDQLGRMNKWLESDSTFDAIIEDAEEY